jgi:hypothetical protein
VPRDRRPDAEHAAELAEHGLELEPAEPWARDERTPEDERRLDLYRAVLRRFGELRE